MKRITLTLMLAVLASCTAVHAQHYVRHSANTGCTNHIIRSCTGYANWTEVLYTKDSESGYLELWVEGVAACRIPVPLAYEVKDMKVYGNLLYFCGKQKFGGFIAVANLHNMYLHATGSGTPPTSAVISYRGLDPKYVSSLEKLVVYGEGNGSMTLPINNANEHIAAVGKGGTMTSANWVAVHIKYNNLPMITPAIFSTAIINVEVIDDQTSSGYEPLPEVLLTDDYVAFVRYRVGLDKYVIHRCNKYNVVGTYVTAYQGAVPQDEVIFNLEGETLENNNIALSTCAPTDIYYNTYEIRLRNIELSGMTEVSSQYIPVGEAKQDDLAMVYNRNQRKLVSSMHYTLPNGGYDYGLIEIDPWYSFTSPYYYSTNAIQDPNYRVFAPMDQTLGAHFVALDKIGWLRKSLPIYSGYNGDCFNLTSFTSHQLAPLLWVNETISKIEYNYDDELLLQEATISDIITTVECSVPE